MNRFVVFVLGLTTGVAATLAFYERDGERETMAEARPVVESTEPLAPRAAQPVVARVEAGPTQPEPPSLDELLAEAPDDVESLIVDGGTFLGGPAGELLRGDDFGRFVRALSRSPSVAAAEHFQKISDEFSQLPSVRAGDVTVQQLGCGRRVCAVSFAGYDRADIDAIWTETSGRPALHPQLQTGAVELSMRERTIVASTTALGSNGFERRLLIGVDPEIRAFTRRSVVVDPNP